MNQYLYRIEPTRPDMPIAPTAAESAIVGEHFTYLKNLASAGAVLHAGRTLNTLAGAAPGFGIIALLATDDSAAQAIMAADPAVRNGIMRATLYTYRTALGHPNLGAEMEAILKNEEGT